jgi:hypothetical protein
MKINEVLLFELYFDDLQLAIKDRIVQQVGSDVSEIPTEEFRKSLADDGFLMSTDELIKALNDMEVIDSADENSIVPKGKIANDVTDPEDQGVDVGAMADDQALGAVKDNLPQ